MRFYPLLTIKTADGVGSSREVNWQTDERRRIERTAASEAPSSWDLQMKALKRKLETLHSEQCELQADHDQEGWPLSPGSPTERDPPRMKRQGISVRYTRTKVIEANEARLRDNRIVAMSDDGSVSRPYKILRTHVLQRMRANGWTTLAITSPNDRAGKTVTAINLAISLARDVKQTVLLVDLDLRRPSIATRFFSEEVPGLSEYITEGRPVADLLVNPGIERLVLLPGSHSFIDSSEILCAPQMIELVEELKTRYEERLILFDMPPVMAGDEVIAFLPYVDSVMLVVEERTSKDELAHVKELLPAEKLIGTVLNKSTEASFSKAYTGLR